MKILHITSSLNPVTGGVAEAVKSFILISEQQSIFNEVVSLDPRGIDYLQSDITVCHSLGSKYGFLNFTKELIPWLTENIERFDAVIINGLWGFHSYAAWKVIHRLQKKGSIIKFPSVFVMPHGMLDPYFQRAKERRFKAIRNTLYWALIEKRIINCADGLLFTSETELQLARETFKSYYPKKEYNVGYGINTPPVFNENMCDAFNRSCPGLKGNPYILFLGRIDLKKGVDLLVKSYIKLQLLAKVKQQQLPKLVIAGPGLDSFFAKKILAAIARHPEIKNNIYFPGMLRGDSKWGALYGCESFVLPSHQENFGIAVVEALACGKPVLISNQVNIWREISNEGAGIIEDDNLIGTENMLKQWLSLTADEKLEMGERAKDSFKKHFKLDKAVNNMIAIIHNTINESVSNLSL
ncbi:glycosyltransferase [Mucilaginibacter sp. E4BP6]|uniref:glycosyltransferase n=1 Tax=Mucilaginibacter sp. E4BP6 TaxID=2723089 RepID=UPI0015CDEE4C|nr:glycosyltransferase [Mucilaginibacter sp. E4BP6]NYE65234.1 glycosyltransferase involved in cell wall biosynthesis [Mucilaginibacter sp. E4BP6]